MSRRPDRSAPAPSVGVVVTGALAVAVVVLFVVSLLFGSRSREEAGDRVAIVTSEESASGFDVLVGRCEDERVRAIEVRDQRQAPLWRVESAKGSFERRFAVGVAGFGFTEAVPLRGLPEGPVEVRVAVGDVVDSEVVDLRDVDGGASVGASCGGSSVGAVGWVFAVGAAFVVSSYVGMIRRGRRR